MTSIQDNGIYTLTNVKGGTCLNLSGSDNRSIVGGGYKGVNQAWVFQRADRGGTYFLKAVGSGHYLCPAGDLYDGQKVVATGTPRTWLVEDVPGVENGVRLSPINNYNICIDLSANESTVLGAPVKLCSRWDVLNQVWRLQKIL